MTTYSVYGWASPFFMSVGRRTVHSRPDFMPRPCMYAAAASLSRTGGRSARITARSARSPRERGSSSPPGWAAPSDPISTNFARGFPDSATAAVRRSHAVLTRRYGGSHRPRKVRL